MKLDGAEFAFFSQKRERSREKRHRAASLGAPSHRSAHPHPSDADVLGQ